MGCPGSERPLEQQVMRFIVQRFRFVLLLLLLSVQFFPSFSGYAETLPVSLVLRSGGKAMIRRAGWTAFSRLNPGVEVEFGDLMDPGGEPIGLLCANLTVQVVPQLGPL